MFNQRQWGPGTSRDAKLCMPCNCHGHATSCHYDEEVDRAAISLDVNGHFQGGGVCDNCTDHTTGINCELCVPGYYRPKGISADDPNACTKCDDCTALGSTGNCELSKDNVDDADDDKGVVVCECRPGYVGLRCDTCADGFRGYPDCEPCPCDPRGVLVDTDCDGDCSCKGNVDGKFCDHCKAGHFALQMNNPEGCSSCYCSGVTTVCASAQLPIKRFTGTDGWLISDISVSEVEEPTLDEHDMISVGNYEIPGIEAYYWLAPEVYLGNKLEAYGGELVFKVHWVVMRGDTSGKPTTGPNVILVGRNGMRIACGDEPYTDGDMTFRITLAEFEDTWYHVPGDVKDIVTRLRRTEYKGDFVTRAQFLSVLTDVKHVMLRAKFHTDQIEGSLEEAYISVGDYKDGYGPVEECSCPSGYTGLSCESCQYGHVRIISNTSSHQQIGFCAKCDCNGHSSSCNLDTGECYCEHNTMGETCERCAPGFYGNPLQGTPKDCKKCACPLEEKSNNFSPSCQLDLLTLSNDDDEPGYVCTQCPKGYTGDHCEICDDGYFGLPSKLGGRCDPCTCGGGPCDRITGQCLGCRGNTEGWRCERCKLGYYGDPVIGCEACLCDPQGSISPNCNNVTGECECKEHFIGRTCNKCETGYGNVTAQCTECTCDSIGSKSNICDPHSGLCDCQPGVEGFRCDACQHLHYGFSTDGCQSCQCNPQGSLMPTCDIRTGQCRCKNYYRGRKCDNCQDGYWNSSKGCVKCDCDREGSKSKNCNQINGHCFCKPGVLSPKCEDCQPHHYGFSNLGCKACDVCTKKGHICHPENGRCVCPPYSHGESCQICNTNTWGHEPGKGCK
ncbi:PREDICTED: laminin subunit alpha-1-like, partial [Nicrophorus vespilloides]|uniref:Laminin subunit alpha-1-like n=1 Tax=Nicrophorus vespilloides TaxID=110193 RepID=A0ABM1M7Z7_NICVS